MNLPLVLLDNGIQASQFDVTCEICETATTRLYIGLERQGGALYTVYERSGKIIHDALPYPMIETYVCPACIEKIRANTYG